MSVRNFFVMNKFDYNYFTAAMGYLRDFQFAAQVDLCRDPSTMNRKSTVVYQYYR